MNVSTFITNLGNSSLDLKHRITALYNLRKQWKGEMLSDLVKYLSKFWEDIFASLDVNFRVGGFKEMNQFLLKHHLNLPFIGFFRLEHVQILIDVCPEDFKKVLSDFTFTKAFCSVEQAVDIYRKIDSNLLSENCLKILEMFKRKDTDQGLKEKDFLNPLEGYSFHVVTFIFPIINTLVGVSNWDKVRECLDLDNKNLIDQLRVYLVFYNEYSIQNIRSKCLQDDRLAQEFSEAIYQLAQEVNTVALNENSKELVILLAKLCHATNQPDLIKNWPEIICCGLNFANIELCEGRRFELFFEYVKYIPIGSLSDCLSEIKLIFEKRNFSCSKMFAFFLEKKYFSVLQVCTKIFPKEMEQCYPIEQLFKILIAEYVPLPKNVLIACPELRDENIRSVFSINGMTWSQMEARLRETCLDEDHFWKIEGSLHEQVILDTELVNKLGFSNPGLADAVDRFFELHCNCCEGKKTVEHPFFEGDEMQKISVRVEKNPILRHDPLGDLPPSARCVVLTNLKNSICIRWTPFLSHAIRVYGFYGGKNSPYRGAPAALIAFMTGKLLKDVEKENGLSREGVKK